MKKLKLAVNGTLMRGFALNKNLVNAGAAYIGESLTVEAYRLWSIGDLYPAMLQDEKEGRSIQVEIWELDSDALVEILEQEPPGLCVGKIQLQDGSRVFGILAEPFICENQREITAWGGWRNYINNNHSL